MALFNDSSHITGGLAFESKDLEGINPDAPPIGLLTREEAWKIFKRVRKQYAEAMQNYERSGNHSNPFFNFCNKDTDVLYLKLYVDTSE